MLHLSWDFTNKIQQTMVIFHGDVRLPEAESMGDKAGEILPGLFGRHAWQMEFLLSFQSLAG